MLYYVGNFHLKGRQIRNCIRKFNSGIFEIPDHVSFAARWLIERMITVDPENRITASEIWKDSWLADKDTYLKDIFYKLNGSVSCTTTLNSRPETAKPDNSPYRDRPNINNDLPYEAYFPWDARKLSKELIK